MTAKPDNIVDVLLDDRKFAISIANEVVKNAVTDEDRRTDSYIMAFELIRATTVVGGTVRPPRIQADFHFLLSAARRSPNDDKALIEDAGERIRQALRKRTS